MFQVLKPKSIRVENEEGLNVGCRKYFNLLRSRLRGQRKRNLLSLHRKDWGSWTKVCKGGVEARSQSIQRNNSSSGRALCGVKVDKTSEKLYS